MFQFFGSQYLAIKSALKGKNSTSSSPNDDTGAEPKGLKRTSLLPYLKIVLFLLLSVYIGVFWYRTYHIREERYSIGQTPLRFDDGSGSISTSFGVDVHVFYDYSGLAYIDGSDTFSEKKWIFREDKDSAIPVRAVPGIQLARTDTIHGRIGELPRISSEHIDRMRAIFGDTIDISSLRPERLNCYYQTYSEASQWNRFLPVIHIPSKPYQILIPDGRDSLGGYDSRLNWVSGTAKPEQSATLRRSYFEPIDSVIFSITGTAWKEAWSRLSLFSDFDLSRVTQRIDFKTAPPYQLYKDSVINENDILGIYSLDNRLNSVHFYYGTAVVAEGGNVMPDSIEDGGFWITDAAKLRLIEREGLALNLRFPQMENMQNARMYLITTMLTASVAYTATLVYREARKRLNRSKRMWLTLVLLVMMIIAWVFILLGKAL